MAGITAAVVEHVRSTDGTQLGYLRSGKGSPLVLVHGTTGAGWSFRFIVPFLVDRFTVLALDRRGRGESEDGVEYSIDREFEDVAAVVDSVGKAASVFGHSFGATVALGAALHARNLDKLILYEPSPGLSAVAGEDVARIQDLIAGGEPEGALVHTFRALGFSPEEIGELQGSPTWPARVDGAGTLARELLAEEAFLVDPEAFSDFTRPTLLLLGERSPEWAARGTDRIRSVLPNARVAMLPGEGHAAIMTAPNLVADEITRFLSGG